MYTLMTIGMKIIFYNALPSGSTSHHEILPLLCEVGVGCMTNVLTTEDLENLQKYITCLHLVVKLCIGNVSTDSK